MHREVRLNRIATVLSELDYPTTPAAVAAECRGIQVELADGVVDLGETIRESHASTFVSPEDIELEFMSLLPRHAVGEPFQSEGDA
jgi:hypothetical protein